MNHSVIARRTACAALSSAGLQVAVWPRRTRAEEPALRRPTEPPILTVSGRIRNTNQGDAAAFDRAMLEELGAAGFTTTTPWYDGPVRFDGVPMAALMRAVGAE